MYPQNQINISMREVTAILTLVVGVSLLAVESELSGIRSPILAFRRIALASCSNSLYSAPIKHFCRR